MTQRDLPLEPRVVPVHGRRGARRLLAAALVVNAGVLVVGSTVATFTGRDAVTQTNSAGRVLIQLDAAGKAAVAVAGPALAAGDFFERAITVEPAGGTIEIGSWTLSAKGSPGSALDSTRDHGLLLTVESCTATAGWTSTEPTPGVRVHACAEPGIRRTVLPERDITFTDASLQGLGEGRHHLLLTVRLAASAPDSLQGLTSTIEYTFGGVQRAGKQR